MFFLRDVQTDFEPEQTRQVLLHTHSTQLHPLRRRPHGYSSSGISSNAVVETAQGPKAARDLRVGDMVHTLDHGQQCLRWIGFSRLNADEGPLVRVMNDDGSRSQMILAPNHLVLQQSPLAEILFGDHEVLCPAHALSGLGRFEPASSATPTLVHLLFDRFELVQVGDFWVESFVPDMPRIRMLAPEVADDIINALPRLAHDPALANYIQDRIVLEGREVNCLFDEASGPCTRSNPPGCPDRSGRVGRAGGST
ncbi:Hint domain-containing protein [Aliiroseovarius crassostreae]|uniref:Hint domain-containing protein n=1 Tax=Aliiroseovarius crassostreae TaxID=154981 RepID=UPI003C7DE78E